VIGPAAGIARRVDVPAPEEIGLHVHLLDFQLASRDTLVHPLMARIEAPDVATHGDHARLPRNAHQRFRIRDAVGDGNFDQHVLARADDLLALPKMHFRRRREDHRVRALDAFREVAGVMRDVVFLRNLRGGVLVAADEGGDFRLGNALERIEVFLAERPLPCDTNPHAFLLTLFCASVCLLSLQRGAVPPPAWAFAAQPAAARPISAYFQE
jgi:hypothetical protein